MSDVESRAKNRRLILASTLLLVGGIGFGLVIALNRVVTTEGIPFIPYIFWQSLGASVVLLVVSVIRRKLPPLTAVHLRYYTVLGIAGLAIPWTVLAYVAPEIPVGVIAILLALGPLIVYAMAVGLTMDSLRWSRVLGLFLGLGGILLIALPETSLPARGMVGWVLVALIPPACFALSTILAERMRPPTGDAISFSCGLLVVGSLFMLPVMAISDSWWVFQEPLSKGEATVFFLMLLSAFLWPLLFTIIRLAGSVFFSTVAYIDTLAGVGWGILFFSEAHSLWIWGALALVMGGLFLVNRRGREPPTGAKAD